MSRASSQHLRAVLTAGGLAIAGCLGSVQVRVGAGPDDCSRDFGSSTAAAKIETYLAAAAELARDAETMERELTQACSAALADAGGVAPAPGGTDPCRDLGEWLERERLALVSAAPLVELGAIACEPSRDSFATCVSRCELRYRPEDIEVAVGTDGLLTAPQASPRCRASCETLSALATPCSQASVTVAAGGELSGEQHERLTRLRTIWERHGPEIARVRERADRVARAASRLISIAPVLPEAAATVSIRAVACASRAASTVSDTTARLRQLVERSQAVLDPQLR